MSTILHESTHLSKNELVQSEECQQEKKNLYYSKENLLNNNFQFLHLLEANCCKNCFPVATENKSLPESVCSSENVIALDPTMVYEIQTKEILHWNYRNLYELPIEIFTACNSNVKEIYLKRNSIIRLPPAIGRLQNLTNLYLSGNQLSLLPDEIGNLISLRVLDISQNNIGKLPNTIGNLKNLEQLILTQNLIQILPKELGQCENLQLLEASSNHIKAIHAEIIDGVQYTLEELGLDRNPLINVPRNISKVKNLQYLSVCHCDLSYLPSFPFYLIENVWSQERTNSTNCHSWKNPVEYDRNLVPKIFFHFDGNPKLNHLPFWMLQAWGIEIESFGCALQTIDHKTTLSCGTKHFRMSNYELHFDPDIYTIHQATNTRKPISLLEQCMRKVFSLSKLIKKEQKFENSTQNQVFVESLDDLPFNLKQICNLGPISECFSCKGPIFIEFWLIFAQFESPSPMQSKIHITEFTFCSSKCYETFSREVISGNNINLGTPNFHNLKVLVNS